MRPMVSCHCAAIDGHFSPARALAELEEYRRRGPTGTARLLLRGLAALGVRPGSLLDVGAGIGVLHHELLERGVARAVHVEGASAYVDVAREESQRRGHARRLDLLHGDAVELAPGLLPADLVTLDRVVCCYPELEPLLQRTAEKARRWYALSYPHDRWYVHAHTWWQNAARRRAGNPFRTFVHPVARIRTVVRELGFEAKWSERTMVWEVLVCARRKAIRSR